MKARIALALLLVSCGSRTGVSNVGPDGDGGIANGDDGSVSDALGSDTGLPGDDSSVPRDAGIDVAPFDADKAGCAPSAAPIYVVTYETSALYSFDPPSAKFTRIGPLKCPGEAMSHAQSMAVNRAGTAYVLFGDGNLYAASTATAACSSTAYVPGQSPGFITFGMGFSSNGGTTAETLFLAGNEAGLHGKHATKLGTLDANFVLHAGGSFDQSLPDMELTGNAAGSLFGFYPLTTDPNSVIVQIDKASAAVVGRTVLEGVTGTYAYAFAFWAEAFYIFTSPKAGAGSNVTRYRPSDGTITYVGSLQETIIGAGVSTCAPD